MTDHPSVTRTYINHHLDSTRWDVYVPRTDDIVITTSYKSGTTLGQQILYNMLVRDTYEDEQFPDIDEASPWMDSRYYPVAKENLAAYIDSFPYRRFLKSHLPLDGLPYFNEVKYLIIARDPRDVFMSLLNHYSAYTEVQYRKVNHGVGRPMPKYDGDARGFFRDWITRGWFEWETEGYPFWSNLHHTQTYWEYRHLPNFLFLHYADMRADLRATIRLIAGFIEHELSDQDVDRIARATSFEHVKQQAVAESEVAEEEGSFQGGQAAFIFKGTDGRWRDLLDEKDLQLYRQTRDRVLEPDCVAWLER
ncbi:MAG: sulfotransferase domain-containing protein [Gammaproteobacteria bacterium]|nr:sulfotransferase domain-containing protein [Gammaproteobacteria bacterium]MBT4494866.1 sulfotransferase domain-containing protein [Gammaproteobacteria bacterium]